ncbi:MAG TPA: hypothetical protein PKC91_07330 [Ignavibacteria bacterium]|nr:hypothetical protein [Ignavibacteria bacterium]
MWKTKKIKLLVTLQLLVVIFCMKCFSQEDSTQFLLEATQKSQQNMTCDDLSDYFAKNPESGCTIDMKICSECLGVQFDIAFDTSTIARDNIISPECADYYSQVTDCLQKILELRKNKYFTYINDHPISNATTYKKLKKRYDYISVELIEIQKLNDMLSFVNSRISKINKFLIWNINSNLKK